MIGVITAVTLIYERWSDRSKNSVLISYNMQNVSSVRPHALNNCSSPSKSKALLLKQSTARLINISVVKVVKENEAWIYMQRVIDEQIFSEMGD
jgi:uncharacterized protein (UPF0548 family)